MTATDRHIIRTVLLHNGVQRSAHHAYTALDISDGHMSKRALRNYRAIYGSLTHEERMAAHDHRNH